MKLVFATDSPKATQETIRPARAPVVESQPDRASMHMASPVAGWTSPGGPGALDWARLPASHLLFLERNAGNAAVSRLIDIQRDPPPPAQQSEPAQQAPHPAPVPVQATAGTSPCSAWSAAPPAASQRSRGPRPTPLRQRSRRLPGTTTGPHQTPGTKRTMPFTLSYKRVICPPGMLATTRVAS